MVVKFVKQNVNQITWNSRNTIRDGKKIPTTNKKFLDFIDNYLLKDPILKSMPRSEIEKEMSSIRRSFTCANQRKEKENNLDQSDKGKIRRQNLKRVSNKQGKGIKAKINKNSNVFNETNNISTLEQSPMGKLRHISKLSKVELKQFACCKKN